MSERRAEGFGPSTIGAAVIGGALSGTWLGPVGAAAGVIVGGLVGAWLDRQH